MADSKESLGKSPHGSKLESLSREDLLKFIKKQLVLLQKERVKNDDLSKSLVLSAENEKQSAEKIMHLEHQVNDVLLPDHVNASDYTTQQEVQAECDDKSNIIIDLQKKLGVGQAGIAELQHKVCSVVGSSGQRNQSFLSDVGPAERFVSDIEKVRYVEDHSLHELHMVDRPPLHGGQDILECCSAKPKKNESFLSDNDDMLRILQLESNLEMTLQERQNLYEERVDMNETHETVVFELAEIQQELDALKIENCQLREKFYEWEHLVTLLKDEREVMVQHLENAGGYKDWFQCEIQPLMCAMREALSNDATFLDKYSSSCSQDGLLTSSLDEMKFLTSSIIMIRDTLKRDMDTVQTAKLDDMHKLEMLQAEVLEMNSNIDTLERAKESASVLVHIAQAKEQHLMEELKNANQKAFDMGDDLKDEKSVNESLIEQLDGMLEAKEKAMVDEKRAREIVEEKIAYAVELESKVFELSNQLTNVKRDNGDLNKKLDLVLCEQTNPFLVNTCIKTLNNDKLDSCSQILQLKQNLKTEEKELVHSETVVMQARNDVMKDCAFDTQEFEFAEETEQSETVVLEEKSDRVQAQVIYCNQLAGIKTGNEELHELCASLIVKDVVLEALKHETVEKLKHEEASFFKVRLEIEELKVKVDELTSMNVSLAATSDQMSLLIVEKEAKNDLVRQELTAQLDMSVAKGDNHLRHIAELTEEKSHLSVEVEKLKADLQDNLGNHRFVIDKIDENQCLVGDMNKVIQSLRQAITGNSNVHYTKEHTVNGMQCDSCETENYVELLQTDIASNQHETEIILNGNFAMGDKLDMLLRQQGNLKANFSLATSEISDLLLQIAAMETDAANAAQAFDMLQCEKISMQERIEDLMNKEDAERSFYQQTMLKLQEVNGEMKNTADKLSGLEYEKCSLSVTLSAELENKLSLQKIVGKLKSELSVSSVELDDVKNRLVIAEEQNGSLVEWCSVLDKFLEECSHLKGSFRDSVNEGSECTKSIQALQERLYRRLTGLVDENDALREERLCLSSDKANIEKQWLDAMQECSRLQSLSEELTADFSALNKDVVRLKQEAAEKDAELASVRQNLYVSVEKHENLCEDNLLCRREKDALQAFISESETNFCEAQQKMAGRLASLECSLELEKKCRIAKEEQVLVLLRKLDDFEDELHLHHKNVEDVQGAIKCLEVVSTQLCARLQELTSCSLDGSDKQVKDTVSNQPRVEVRYLPDIAVSHSDVTVSLPQCSINGQLMPSAQQSQVKVNDQIVDQSHSTVEHNGSKTDCLLLGQFLIHVEEATQISQVTLTEVLLVQKSIFEKDEMIGKLKKYAMRSKMELQDLKTKFELETRSRQKQQSAMVSEEQLVQDRKQLQKTNSMLQESLDNSFDELEQGKRLLSESKKDVDIMIQQLVGLRRELADSDEDRSLLSKKLQESVEDNRTKDSQIDELKTKLHGSEIEISAVRLHLEDFSKEKQILSGQIGEIRHQLECERNERTLLQNRLASEMESLLAKLNVAKQNAQNADLMDLELADYERTVLDLNHQLEDRDNCIASLRAEVGHNEQHFSLLRSQIVTMEEKCAQTEERCVKQKHLLDKTKEDLWSSQKKELAYKSMDLELKDHLESFTQQVEEYKVQLQELGSVNQTLQDKLRCVTESDQRTIRSLESRVTALKDDLEMSRCELKAVHTEFDGYKVRAQNVLNKQKVKISRNEHSELDEMERQRLETTVDQLKHTVHDVNQQMRVMQEGADALNEDHKRLTFQHNKLLHDAEQGESASRARIDELTQERIMAMHMMEEKLRQLQLQHEMKLQTEKSEVATVMQAQENKIQVAQLDLESLQSENRQLGCRVDSMQTALLDGGGKEGGGLMLSPLTEPKPDRERREGEVMEIVNSDLSSMPGPKILTPAISFDKLLSTAVDDLPSSLPLNTESLQLELLTVQKKSEHLTELLSESEESVSLMTEQTKVLKEEIRRLYRNQQREDELKNLEYLKNILMKFLTRSIGEERTALVPVIHTMLKLNDDEKDLLMAIANGDEQHQTVQKWSGWGSYLHRWSGIT